MFHRHLTFQSLFLRLFSELKERFVTIVVRVIHVRPRDLPTQRDPGLRTVHRPVPARFVQYEVDPDAVREDRIVEMAQVRVRVLSGLYRVAHRLLLGETDRNTCLIRKYVVIEISHGLYIVFAVEVCM